MERKTKQKKSSENSAVFKVGAIAFAFLIIGYQAALFIHRASVLRIEAGRDRPDTVFVVNEDLARRLLADDAVPVPDPVIGSTRPSSSGRGMFGGMRPSEDGLSAATGQQSNGQGVGRKVVIARTSAQHSETVERVREATRKVESFRFNPNTVSVGDLRRLGFSEKQAAALDNYRKKGGRFRRKSDFANSFVVEDSVYRRLEEFIDIPRIDINKADSAAFDTLPGIGGWFAARMVSYREELGGYSCTEQLMEIWHFDREKYDGLSDLICCSPPAQPFRLWTLPAGDLRRHPHVRSYETARAIVLYRENNPKELLTVDGLEQAGVLTKEAADKLARCLIEEP